MKKFGIAAGVLAALLLGPVCRTAWAQYAFVGDRAVGGPTLQMDVFNQTTGAEVGASRPDSLTGDMTDMKIGPDGNIYAFQGNNTMLVFNGSTGAFLRTVTLGYTPTAFTFGPDGNIYIAVTTHFGKFSTHYVYKLQGPVNVPAGSSVGALLGAFTSNGAVVSCMSFHSGAGGASCELLCLNAGVISRYDASGAFISNLSLNTAITNFSVGPDGGVYASSVVPDNIYFNRYHNIIQRFAGSPLQATNWFVPYYSYFGGHSDPLPYYPNQKFYQVWGPDNNLYIADSKGDNTGTDNVYKVTPALDSEGRPNFGVIGTATTFISNLQLPLSLTFLQQPLGAAFPQTYSSQIAFRETGASIWNPALPGNATASYLLGPSWNTGGTVTAGGFVDISTPSIDFGLFTIPSIDFGEFGATASVNSFGTAGIKFTGTVDSGSVNVNYPVTVNMDFGDRNYLFAGDWNPVYTTYAIDPSANLGTLSPHASASIDLVMNGYLRAEGKAEAFNSTIFDTVITPPVGSASGGAGNFDYGRNLFNTDSLLGGGQQKNYSLLDNIVSGYVKLPSVSAAGMPNPAAPDPRVIATSGQDTFFNIKGSLSNLARQIIQDSTGLYIPLGNDSASAHLLGSGFDLGYSFLDLYANVDLNVKQDITFAPKPHVKLQLPSGVLVNWKDKNNTTFSNANFVEFDAGDTIQIQMPTNPILQFTPTYTLPNTFTQSLSLVMNPSLQLNPIELTGKGSVAGYSLGSFDFKPIATQTIANTSLAFPLATSSFTLPGFQTVTQTGITVSGRLHPAPALAVAMPSQIPLLIVPYQYNSTTLPDNVTGMNGANGVTTLTVSGMTFPTSGSQAYFTIHGSPPVALTTRYLDPCDLSVDLPNKYLLIAGTGQIYVTIPNAAGNSNSLNISVMNPIPQIKNTGPNVYAADPNLGGNLLLTVTDQSTTYLWSASYYNILQSKWFSSYNGTGTNSNMAAFYPGYDFNAVTPLPAIHYKASDGIDHTLAMYQESNPSGLLWAVLPLSYYADPDTAKITVVSPAPGGGTSNVLPLTIGTAVPQVTSLSPNTVLPGSGGFRLTVLGPLSQNAPPNPGPYGNFNGASVIYWDGSPVATAFVSAGELAADIPAGFVAAAGTHTVKVVTTVANGAGGGTSTLTSGNLGFSVASLAPQIRAVPGATIALYPAVIVSADKAFLGSPSAPQYNLTVNGQNFDAASVVQWNGTALTTLFVNDTTLAAAVPYANVAAPGTAQITIANSTTGGGGGVSNSATFTITNAKPGDTVLTALALTALAPNYVQDGGSSATGGIQGEGFYAGSIVNVNGSPRPTTFKAHNALTYTLSAADIATAGATLQITVTNPAPGGGTTAALPLAIGGTVSGTLTFEGIANIASAQNVTFTFRPTDNSAVQTRIMAVPANGVFSVGGLPHKTYTLHIKGDKYLAVNVSVNATSGSASGIAATLPAGDANNDNSCDSTDFGLLIGAYGSDSSIPGSGYDPTVDFNGDGVVDSTDFGLLIGEFNNTGAM